MPLFVVVLLKRAIYNKETKREAKNKRRENERSQSGHKKTLTADSAPDPKIRPVIKLADWKTAEFSFSYVVCWIKFASSTRLLIFTKTLVVDTFFCSYLLQNISGDSLIFHGKIFMFFSNFVDYFKLFGSVDNVCCFSSECYLGLVTHGLLNFKIVIIK